jgi:lipoprotein-anchoring transpeptidase ErfK/SrfK
VTEEVAINVERTIAAVRAAVEAGQNQAAVVLTHQPHIYTVQPGDTLMLVAHAHGFPVWRLTEANPGVEPGELWPGQPIVIPSVDVLFPLPLITERRIVIDISDQRLYAYERDTLVHNFIASTGIASSPTILGVFQVLSKEKEAYASSWDLWMPHFMGIYRTGPDFTNGIHGLPTLSSGIRLWEGYLGRPVSYGCIVIGLGEAAALYEWTELGTLVVIQE